MKTHHAIISTFAAMALLALNSTARAQGDFQLPRECSERQNVDLPQCTIQNGPPRAPWVHTVKKIPAGAKPPNTSAPTAAPSTASDQTSSSARTAAPR